MALMEAKRSGEIAAILVNAWERADMTQLASYLEAAGGGDTSDSSFESECQDLVNGIAANLRQSLSSGDVHAMAEMDTSMQLLRHIVRMNEQLVW